MTVEDPEVRIPIWVGLAIIALAFVSAAQAFISYSSDEARQKCLLDIIKTQNQVIRLRSDLADQQYEALDQVILGAATSQSDEQTRFILTEYVKKSNQLKLEREKSEIPPLPRATCEE